MDDANLAKLTVNQVGLKPNFHKDTINYDIVVAFNVEILKISASTSDTGASFSIKSNTGYGEDVKLNEGENKITIEVTSEDGTIKKYFINCLRLSASAASLKSLEFENLDLLPKFDTSDYEYKASTDFKRTEIKFKLDVFDPNCGIEVSFNKSTLTKTNDSNYVVSLNYGLSEILIKATSPNKTKTQIYSVKITRNPLPRLCSYLSIKDKLDFDDPITLSPIYCAINLDEATDKNAYSDLVIKVFYQIATNDQLNFISLSSQNPAVNSNLNTEIKVSDCLVRIPYLNGEFSKEISLKTASNLIDEANSNDKFKTADDSFKTFTPTNINNMPESLPAYQVKPWEKQLQIIYDETEGDKLFELSREFFEKYALSLSTITSKKQIKKDGNDTPSYYLNMSLYNAATGLKFKNKDYKNHFWLATLLEEKQFYEYIYGAEKKDEEVVNTLSLQNKLAADGSKEEEIDAICKARNVGPTASNCKKLKALDEEYHYLIESHQNFKAEQIQLLYQFKAKKIISESKSGSKTAENNNYIYQANLKYLDGITLILANNQTNFTAFFTMGRSFCSIGDYSQALSYLKNCLVWSDNQFQTLARFYFAYAYCKKIELNETTLNVILYYLCSGLQMFLENISKNLTKNNTPFAEDYFNIYNIEFIEGFLLVGKIKSKFSVKLESISAEDAFRYCGWISSIALIELNKRTTFDKELFQTSKLIKDLLKLLIESHYNLVNLPVLDKDKLTSKTIETKRYINLIELIRSITNRDGDDVLKIQEKITQKLVCINPFECYNLVLLGSSKLEIYDFLNENKLSTDSDYLNELLDNCKNIFIVCNEIFDGKTFDNVPNLISDQKWWKETQEQMKKIETKKEAPPANRVNSASKTDKSPAKPLAAKPPANTKAPPAKAQPAPPKKPVPNQKAAPNPQPKNAPQCKPDPKANATSEPKTPPSSSNQTVTEPEPPKETEFIKIEQKINIPKNVLYAQIQLNTARVYSRLKEFDKAKSFYQNVIKKEPKKQDAYIELANMLKSNNNIMGAVDVYSSYPIENDKNSKEPKTFTFDDAFIFGELVTLLISIQNYDDPRLTKYLILWAQVMGINIIEKYINILDKANKTKACKEVYASVHKKSVDDPDLIQFFKFKGWF